MTARWLLPTALLFLVAPLVRAAPPVAAATRPVQIFVEAPHEGEVVRNKVHLAPIRYDGATGGLQIVSSIEVTVHFDGTSSRSTGASHSTSPSVLSTRRIGRGDTRTPGVAKVVYASVSSIGRTDGAPIAVDGTRGTSVVIPMRRAYWATVSIPTRCRRLTATTFTDCRSASRNVSGPAKSSVKFLGDQTDPSGWGNSTGVSRITSEAGMPDAMAAA